MKKLLPVYLLLFSQYLVAQVIKAPVVQSKTIDEAKFVLIGGVEQWVTIKGSNRSKPVILFLHGGPGSVMSPYNDAVHREWQKDFILVHWDQRGAGRTFGRNAPVGANEDYWMENPLTIKQMTVDAIEVSEYLIQSLGKKKIIVLGTSWGSVLGARIVLERPDLYSAYIGHSQVVNASEGLVHAYNKVCRLADQGHDHASVDKLKLLGVPPYDDAKTTGQLFRIIKKYEQINSTPAPASWWDLAPAYANESDNKHREDGDDYSFINYVGHKKLGIKAMMADVDFMKNGLDFKVPVYFIQGQHDILTPPEITKAYFDKIKAPKKEYFLLPAAAHGFNQSVIDTQYKILKERL